MTNVVRKVMNNEMEMYVAKVHCKLQTTMMDRLLSRDPKVVGQAAVMTHHVELRTLVWVSLKKLVVE